MVTTRDAELKRILEERRRLLQSDVQDKIRDVRDHGIAGGNLRDVLDGVEVSEADVQEEIELGLIQVKIEILGKIDEALVRLRNGDYGICVECGVEISETRLRALPFAVRCRACEESHEAAQAQRARELTLRYSFANY